MPWLVTTSGSACAIGHAANGIGEDAGGIDDDARGDGELFARFFVAGSDAVDVALAVAQKAGRRAVIHERCAVIGGGHGEMDEKARVVELAVVVDHAAAQFFRLKCRQPLQSLFLGEKLRCAKAIFAGEQVVELEADAVEGRLPPGVIGHDESEIVDEVRRVLAKQAAFFQRRHHERDIALLEIAHAAMDELGAAAAGALAEVVRLEQDHVEAARSCIDGDAHAGCATADDGDVPGLLLCRAFADVAHHFFSAHCVLRSYSVQFLDRSTARCQRALRAVRSFASIFGSKRTSSWRLERRSSGLGQKPVASPAR